MPRRGRDLDADERRLAEALTGLIDEGQAAEAARDIRRRVESSLPRLELGLFTLYSLALLSLFYGRSARSLLSTAAAALAVVSLTAPW